MQDKENGYMTYVNTIACKVNVFIDKVTACVNMAWCSTQGWYKYIDILNYWKENTSS